MLSHDLWRNVATITKINIYLWIRLQAVSLAPKSTGKSAQQFKGASVTNEEERPRYSLLAAFPLAARTRMSRWQSRSYVLLFGVHPHGERLLAV